jgi:hypothetical protein
MTTREYFAWFDDSIRTTEALYQLVPSESLNWKPTANSFTIGQLIEHMPRALSFNSKIIASEDWPLKSMREILVANRHQESATVDAALQHPREQAVSFKNAVVNLGEALFQFGSVNTPQWGTLPIWRFAIFVLEHHLNHKMELHVDLRIVGVNVNTKSLYAGKPG